MLAGDGLLTRAFEVLSDPDTHGDPAVRCELVAALAAAAGGTGMVGGQMIDLIAESRVLDIGAITRLQRMKTGALIAFSCEAGAILAKAARARTALRLCPRPWFGFPSPTIYWTWKGRLRRPENRSAPTPRPAKRRLSRSSGLNERARKRNF